MFNRRLGTKIPVNSELVEPKIKELRIINREKHEISYNKTTIRDILKK